MKRALLLAAVCGVLTSAAALAAADPHAHGADAPSPLDRLKALEGTRTGTAGMGVGEPAPLTVNWHVTAAGSAVVETQFAGTPHEMLTVYTAQGPQLVLAHN